MTGVCFCVIFFSSFSLHKPIGALPGRDYVVKRIVLKLI